VGSQTQVSDFLIPAHLQFDFLIIYLFPDHVVEMVELAGATAGVLSHWENWKLDTGFHRNGF